MKSLISKNLLGRRKKEEQSSLKIRLKQLRRIINILIYFFNFPKHVYIHQHKLCACKYTISNLISALRLLGKFVYVKCKYIVPK